MDQPSSRRYVFSPAMEHFVGSEETDLNCKGPMLAPAITRLEKRKGWREIGDIVAVVTALHLALPSVLFGPRQTAYAMTAYFSAVMVWGTVFLLNGKRRIAAWIVGAPGIAVIQQMAYHTLPSENTGFWWPFIQFASLHFLIGTATRALLWRGRGYISGHW